MTTSHGAGRVVRPQCGAREPADCVVRCGNMQLSLHDEPRTLPQGLSFSVTMGRERVPCFITRAALIFLAGHFLLARDYVAIFDTYSSHLLAISWQKYKKTHACPLVLNANDLI